MNLRLAVTCLLLLSFALNLCGQEQDQEVVRITTNSGPGGRGRYERRQTHRQSQTRRLRNPRRRTPAADHQLRLRFHQWSAARHVVTTNNAESPVVILKPPLPKEIKRTVAIVVDDLGMSFQSMANLRTYLTKFLNENVRPNDLIAIIRTGGEVGALQQFTL